MSKRTIVLTGFMGTGKSTVGQILASRTGRRFVDTDALIEARAGQGIASIFSDHGEDVFRQYEIELSHELAGVWGLVIATGGGMLTNPDNAALLGQDAHVFCLVATGDEIVWRLRSKPGVRPLLTAADPTARVEELLRQRQAAYARFPQIETTGRSADEVAETIVAELRNPPLPVATPLTVTHPSGSYEVVVGSDLLPRWRAISGWDRPALVISDTNVAPLHAGQLTQALDVISIPAGEENKTLETVRQLYDQVQATGLDRSGAIIALGGGVVGDVAGFVAATYLRGVPVIQCPTSVLAMVDASVGGKTGVDLPQGKNLVGAYKQPQTVIADLSTLRTLPEAEFSSGLAEVVKGALIGAPRLLERLENGPLVGIQVTSAEKRADLQGMILETIDVKRTIVQEDPFESGRRAVLNLGHTFGHALEQSSGYRIRHGEAVAIGLVAAANLSARLGQCSATLQERIESLLTQCGLPVRIPPHLNAGQLLRAMDADKKRESGRLRFVLLHGVGDAFITADVPSEAVLSTLMALGAGS